MSTYLVISGDEQVVDYVKTYAEAETAALIAAEEGQSEVCIAKVVAKVEGSFKVVLQK